MKNTHGILILILLMLPLLGHAQQVVDMSSNAIRANDRIEVVGSGFSFSGDAGKDVTWDISQVLGDSHTYISFESDSTGGIVRNDGKSLSTFVMHGDSLLQTGYETPLEQIAYSVPVLTMRYPMGYGDTWEKDFHGDGTYCHQFHERRIGKIQSVADGYGRMIISETDTLRNVLRVYTLKTSSIQISPDSCINNPERLKQEIEERYQWYARGFRYPVYETITSTSYDNLTPVATRQYAHCCMPEIQRLLSDDHNEQIAKEDSLQQLSSADIFRYEVSNRDNVIQIDYALDKPAHIRTVVADVMGMVYRNQQRSCPAAEHDVMTIDCSGLRRGHYILYMNVDGKVYNAKISVK
ncbi:MAG: hypothetical protein IJ069_03200 [Prevotella sp.]|nr:hypothetical protein [Prevotella sp.]